MNHKKLIIFDLDGTLTVSKSPMDVEMGSLLVDLLRVKDVAVISGGSFSQFEKQLLNGFSGPQDLLRRFYLFPTCSTSFYRYNTGGWINVYQQNLTDDEKARIRNTLDRALPEAGYVPPKNPHGEIIEDRGTQVTFSALGQLAPIQLKETWDPDHSRRKAIIAVLQKYIPEFEIRSGGTTSIDIIRKGIDKKYGIEQIMTHLGFRKEEMLYVGDAIFEGGNDWPAKQAGVDCVQVGGHEETKLLIRSLIQTSAATAFRSSGV